MSDEVNPDELAKSQETLFSVIPAKAGIQGIQAVLDSRLRGRDGFSNFLRSHQPWFVGKEFS
jgi:hypothetical protein